MLKEFVWGLGLSVFLPSVVQSTAHSCVNVLLQAADE